MCSFNGAIPREPSSVEARLGFFRLFAIGAGLLATVVSTGRVYPHQLAYFNEIAGGPENGHRHLLHSNLDWGQDLLLLKAWTEKQSLDGPLHLAFCSTFDPCDLGVFSLPLPQVAVRTSAADETIRRSLSSGWVAVSENHLHGFSSRIPDSCLEYIKQLPEVGRCGYSIRIYRAVEQESP